jgi:REP element-mobilizing transposase RayT
VIYAFSIATSIIPLMHKGRAGCPSYISINMSKNYYRRHLPHWQPNGADYFITFRLAGTLPKEGIMKLKNLRKRLQIKNEKKNRGSDELSDLQIEKQHKIFKKYEQLLDGAETGPTWLSKQNIADIIKESLHYRDQHEYDLYAYCIMPNHVHLVFQLLNKMDKQSDKNVQKTEYPVTKILQNLKWYTALKANERLKRKGAFWQSESYDHVIRDADELEGIIGYALNNPVKAGLVKHWKDWPNSYCKEEFAGNFE